MTRSAAICIPGSEAYQETAQHKKDEPPPGKQLIRAKDIGGKKRAVISYTRILQGLRRAAAYGYRIIAS